MQAGGSKYVEKGKVAKFVTQLAAQFIEDKMRISILSIICVCGESKNVAEYYCDAFDCAIMLIECTFFTGDNFSRNNFGSGNFGGNFNAGDNYRNFGGAGSSFGGNQTNIGGFGGQANQSSGFNSPQPQQQQQQQQQQQSNFSNQMGVGGGGGSFGNQGNSFSSNAGEFSAVPFGNLIKILVRSFIRLLIRFLCYLSKIKILTLHLD